MSPAPAGLLRWASRWVTLPSELRHRDAESGDGGRSNVPHITAWAFVFAVGAAVVAVAVAAIMDRIRK
jgi:hypothetical protein